MLYKTEGQTVVGYASISNPAKEQEALAFDSSLVLSDLPADKPLECYEHVGGVIKLKADWETIKAAIEASLPANTPPLDVAYTEKKREINAAYAGEMNALVAEYPETERDSWGKQESEARAWLADNTAHTPFMDAMLLVRTDTTKTQLADRIITKADALADATGQLTGKRHVLEATVAAATTTAEVEAVTW